MENTLHKKRLIMQKSRKKKSEKSLQISFKGGSCHVMTVMLNKQKRN